MLVHVALRSILVTIRTNWQLWATADPLGSLTPLPCLILSWLDCGWKEGKMEREEGERRREESIEGDEEREGERERKGGEGNVVRGSW